MLALPAGGLLPGAMVLSGTAQPGSTVLVLVDGRSAGTAVVDAQGVWTLPLADLPPGDHWVQLELLDSRGAVVVKSAPVALMVAAAQQPAPTATLRPPAAAGTPGRPPAPTLLLAPGATFTRTAVISGTAAPGSLIRLLVDGKDAVATRIDDSGQWTLTIGELPPGEHTIQVEMIDARGRPLAASQPLTIVVAPGLAPAAGATATAAPVAPAAAPGTAAATAAPGAAAVTPPAVAAPLLSAPASQALTGATTIGGHAQPGGTIRVTVDGRPVATIQVDATGTWTSTLPALAAGDHLVQVVALDAAGHVVGKAAPLAITGHGPPAASPDHLPTTGLDGGGSVTVAGVAAVLLVLAALMVVEGRRRR